MNLRPLKYRVSKKSLFVTAVPLAGFSSAVLNSILFFIGSMTELIKAIYLPNREPLHVLYIILGSLIPSILFGFLLLFLSFLLKKEAWRIFRGLCVFLFFLVGCAPFLMLIKIPIGAAILLAVMQGICLGSILIFFRWKGVVLAP